MTIMTKNFIAGEWAERRQRLAQHQPVQHQRRRRRVRAGLASRTLNDAIAAAKAAFPAWSPLDAAGALRHPEEGLATRSSPARTSSAACSRARRARPCPRASARPARAGQIFAFFAGEACASRGEKLAVRASRRRRRDHARAGRRRRPDHALELPDRHPGLEDRARRSPTATASCSSPPTSCPAAAWALADIIAARRPAQGRVQPGHGPRLGRRPGAARAPGRRTPSPSPARSRPAARSRAACIAATPMKKVQLEMGGKNPLVVLDDADLKIAVECAVNGAFFSTGQRCTASSRLIVTAGIHDRFVAACVERLKGARRRRRAEGRHPYRPGRRPEPARPGPELHPDRQGRGRASSPSAASC